MNIRNYFPAISDDNIYFDSASTTLKPSCVMEALVSSYTKYYTNINRASYSAALKTQDEFDRSICKIKEYFNITDEYELILTTGATESLNILSRCFLHDELEGKVIIGSPIEHHSNYLPWKVICSENNAEYFTLDYDIANSKFLIENIPKNIYERSILAAVSYVSNVLGNVNKIEPFISAMHAKGLPVVIDASQAVPHIRLDIQALDADFLAFSAHKMFGPFGIGALVLKKKYISSMSAWKYGGGMVLNALELKWKSGPDKFYAGTINPPAVIAWSKALEFIEQVGMENMRQHIHKLTSVLYTELSKIHNIRLYNENISNNVGIISFNCLNIHSHDVGEYLNSHNIYVGVGHHCAQPLMNFLHTSSLVRISLHAYNKPEEIDKFVKCIAKLEGD